MAVGRFYRRWAPILEEVSRFLVNGIRVPFKLFVEFKDIPEVRSLELLCGGSCQPDHTLTLRSFCCAEYAGMAASQLARVPAALSEKYLDILILTMILHIDPSDLPSHRYF